MTSRIFIFLLGVIFFWHAYASVKHENNCKETVPKIEAQVQQKIDINKADGEALQTLKGIGPKKAQAIIDYRLKQGNFHSLNDLIKVKGVSQRILDKILEENSGRITAEG